MDVDQELARAQLKALARVPGALKVITSEIRPELRHDRTDPRSPLHPKHDESLLLSPATMVCHDVTKLEGPDDRGRMVAHTAEGDWTSGLPAALLRRLQEWRAAP